MASKRRAPRPERPRQTTLPAVRGIDLLRTRHAVGQHMLSHPRIEPEQLSTWTQATSDLLRRMFGEDRVATSFSSSGPVDDAAVPNDEGTRQRLLSRLAVLAELIERAADLYENPVEDEQNDESAPSNRVLLVHVRDQEPLQSVASFLERIGCDPVFFHESESAPTRLENLAQSSSTVVFAVVLLTGDDLGRDKQQPPGSERPRASQNAILELGYLIAALGRKNVCVLHYPSVEVPSDAAGVVFIPFDEHAGWQSKLVRELQAAQVAGEFSKLA